MPGHICRRSDGSCHHRDLPPPEERRRWCRCGDSPPPEERRHGRMSPPPGVHTSPPGRQAHTSQPGRCWSCARSGSLGSVQLSLRLRVVAGDQYLDPMVMQGSTGVHMDSAGFGGLSLHGDPGALAATCAVSRWSCTSPWSCLRISQCYPGSCLEMDCTKSRFFLATECPAQLLASALCEFLACAQCTCLGFIL